MSIRDSLSLFGNRRVGAVLLLGFACGLPLSLTGSTLQAWYTVSGVDLVTIGFLGLVGQPYVYKFLWAPLLDRFVPPFLGRRRGWMLISQCMLALLMLALAGFDPAVEPYRVAALALCIAFVSATQDVAVDAYRTDVLAEAERGAGAAVYVAGYRVAMLVAGGLALVFADHLGWPMTFGLLAALMLVGMAGSLFGPEPVGGFAPPASLRAAVVEPFRDFLQRDHALALLALIVLYKLGDAFAGNLTVAFLLRGAGFSMTDVGLVNKVFGLAATLAGAFGGAVILARVGLYRSLLWFGVLQAVSNLGFLALALAGKHYGLMVTAIGIENLSGGLGTAAFVALLMALCNHRYSATQFALFSALAAVGRVFVGPASGYLVEAVGWPQFFVLTTLAALPGLWLLWRLRRLIMRL